MTGRPKYGKCFAQNLSPTAPTIVQSAAWSGQCAERQLKKPRQHERENIDICINHCPHPDKPWSGEKRRMEKCREEHERNLKE